MSVLPPIELLNVAAEKLGDLCKEVVFLGGAVVTLLVVEEGGLAPRATKDVDVAIELSEPYIKLVELDQRLLALGFRNDPHSPVCRYIHGISVVDVIPVNADDMGNVNSWYPLALQTAESHTLANGIEINVIAAECFLGTKMMAFRDLGREYNNDKFLSRDFGDSIRVIDGRPTIANEVLGAREDLRNYLQENWSSLLAEDYFEEAIAEHIEAGREDIVIERLHSFLLR
jgi:hypothetical protein